MKNKSLPFILFCLIGAIVILYNSVFIVTETEQVVITQFGKPVGEPITRAGIQFKIPFIQKTTYFDNRILSWDGEPKEIPTNDKTFIWVECAARWRIADPLLFLMSFGNETAAINRMNDLIDGAIRDLVTKNVLSEIILSSDWKKEYVVNTETTAEVDRVIKVGRDKYSEIIKKNLKPIMKSFGIELMDILIKRINYTDQVRNKVYERMISERKRIAARKRSEGEGEKANILGKLEKELSEIQSTSEKTANIIKGKADAEGARIYGVSYNKDPEFYSFFQSLNNYEHIIKGNSKLIIGTDSELYKYLKDIQ